MTPIFLFLLGLCASTSNIDDGQAWSATKEDINGDSDPRCFAPVLPPASGPVIGRPFIVQGKSRTATSETNNITNMTHATSWKISEAPSVMLNNSHNQEIGRRWLEQAEAEHASVAAFARHTLQLMSIGAPSDLLVASQKASLDEIKHAKMCYGFASAFIGSDFQPGVLDVGGGLGSMDLKEIIRSIIQEGCIEETLSAIDARLAAHHAQDATIKTALLEIASDETRHAQLAWDTIQWIIGRYPDTSSYVDEVFRTEVERQLLSTPLSPATLHAHDGKGAFFRAYGILVKEDKDKVREAGIQNIITPVYLTGFKNVSVISKRITKLDVSAL